MIWFTADYHLSHKIDRSNPVGKQYDVGIDNNNFNPVSYKELITIMNKKPDNLNFIPPSKRNRKLTI